MPGGDFHIGDQGSLLKGGFCNVISAMLPPAGKRTGARMKAQERKPAIMIDMALLPMLLVFALILVALVLYISESLPLEVTSLGVICALILLFTILRIPDAADGTRLDAVDFLAHFANPALITILALLVMGEGLKRTGLLDLLAERLHRATGGRAALALVLVLVLVAVISGVMNNIPVVVIFIPVLHALALRAGRPASRTMMPLGFASILGGMTTLIGSSTNLLVSGALIALGEAGFSFFSFTIPGLVVAGVGLIYVCFLLPRLLPDRDSGNPGQVTGARQFESELRIDAASRFCGLTPVGGFFPALADINILSITRGGQKFLPPYEDGNALQAGDLLVIAATRPHLMPLLMRAPESLYPDIGARPGPASGPAEDEEDRDKDGRDRPWASGAQSLAEMMVTPNAGMIGRTIKEIGFRYRHGCIVLGLERRSRMMRQRPTEIPLAPGDILLVQGRREHIERLRGRQDVVLMEWSAVDLPRPENAWRAGLIFAAVVLAAATGLLPTVIAAVIGATLVVLCGVLTIAEARDSLDEKIIFTVAAALSMGAAMQATGGAVLLADVLYQGIGQSGVPVILSAFFLLVAVLANILSTKATAVLFTPIAVALAHATGAPVEAFAVAVVFAANCSFASPIGYQTNLLVMAPGGYRFMDFTRAGTPLLILCWLTFSLLAPVWFDLS